MAKDYGLTEEQVEAEIARLNASEAVALARYATRLKNKRRQYLYNLVTLRRKARHLWMQALPKRCLRRCITRWKRMAKITLTVKEAARLMGATEQYVRVGIQKKQLPIGYAVQISGGRYTYNIPVALFEKYTGITVEDER